MPAGNGDTSDLNARVDQVPDAPGVYIWKDDAGEPLYVGKAKSLRKRMKQYLLGQDEREKIPLMMEQATDFDYVVTDSEIESLILEKNLIKQFGPPFNVDYRDDKSYPFIALTMADPFPAIKFTRERHRKGTRYFGPYTNAKAARATIEAVRRVYPICSAQCIEWKRLTRRGGEPAGKACFDYSVGRGPGPCVGAISTEEYAETVRKVVRFLEGGHSDVAAELERRMHEAAADLDFEQAARLRNRLEAVRAVQERQKMVSSRPLDVDVIGFEREETIAGASVFVVRDGRVLIGNEFVMDKGLDVPFSELVEGFLMRYYDEASYIPGEVLLPVLPDDPEPVEEWLSSRRGKKVRLVIPKRGEKRELLELVERNAKHTLMRFKVRTRYEDERINNALLQLENALALSSSPMRIECYDISTIHGRHSVGSMVLFVAGRAERGGYRRFRVRMDSDEANDVAMMSEVLRRRFAPERRADERFGADSDLVIVDGGKPQLNAAVRAMEEVGAGDIPVVALAKREEELFVPGWTDPVVLPPGSASLYLVKRIRDEAHRFAITYHRELRRKAMTASILDEIPRVGPARKKALLKTFGSLRRLRQAAPDEIARVPGIPSALAEDIADFLAELPHRPDDEGEG